jgi:ribosomal protein S18 acetylase RimI-like enzyme
MLYNKMRIAQPPFRPARQEDASVLAQLVNYAGEGMPLYLWGKLAGAGATAWEIGRIRAARESGSFSYRNATVIEHDGRPVACLIGYEIPDEIGPVPPDMPVMFVPLQELENQAPGTWYVNVLAVLPEHRNRGFGSNLLRLADETGRDLGKRGMSVIVSDANSGARRLYEKHGYSEVARRSMIKENWINEGQDWVLLTKGL